MKTLFCISRNDQNVSRVSWKIWKIERQRKRVTAPLGGGRGHPPESRSHQLSATNRLRDSFYWLR